MHLSLKKLIIFEAAILFTEIDKNFPSLLSKAVLCFRAISLNRPISINRGKPISPTFGSLRKHRI